MKAIRNSAIAAALVSMIGAGAAHAEPVRVSLADYAFDFPAYGYEITVVGETSNFHDTLTADDYITIKADGYQLKTLIDRMSRKDRQQFLSFFNGHCIVGFAQDGCLISASGDIELDENMRMIFRISTAQIVKGGSEWNNVVANRQ